MPHPVRQSLRLPLLALLLLTTTGCATSAPLYEPAPEQLGDEPAVPFEAYQAQVREHLEQYLVPVDGFAREDQVEWNLPFQRAAGAECEGPRTGLLLVHGLSDSPFVFRDMAERLSKHCVTVRTVLLQGHGTRPGDLVEAESAVWQRQVNAHFEALRSEVDRAFIGGFSIGGALATVRALDADQPRPAGLIAIAPAWELNGLRDYLWMASAAALVRDFVEEEPERNPVKYESLAINAAAQVADVRSRVQALLEATETIDLPLFLMASAADSVINLDFLARQFRERFTHPDSRMLVFRDQRQPLPEVLKDERLTTFDGYLPEHRILEMSHMSLNNSADNPLYGPGAPLHRCLEPNNVSLQQCQALAEDALWFSAWHDEPRPVPTSRLTWNPHFEAVMERMTGFINRLR